MSYREAIMAIFVSILIIYLSVVEVERRLVNADLVARMNAFMSTGPRFTSEQGRAICEAARGLQVEHDYVQPINCKSVLGEKK